MDIHAENRKFNRLPLRIVEPTWNSPLVQTIVELEKLRVRRLSGSVPPGVFFQIKEIFQTMESLGSARIESNHTTLAQLVDKIIEGVPRNTHDESLREIFNIERAIDFIVQNILPGQDITIAHLREIHRIIVDGLTPPPRGEGSRTPGELRSIELEIKGAPLVLPNHTLVPELIEELLRFVNSPVSPQNDLLVTALAHHRLAWIHPFDNGNGRVVRMFTYAMLIRQGFRVSVGGILNPTAVFCNNRDEYYSKLSLADTGEEVNILEWCQYVLGGLKIEIEKIDRLLNLKYTINKILLPALDFSLDRKHITIREHKILSSLVKMEGMIIRSSDLELILGKDISSVQRSRILAGLREKNMLVPVTGKKNIYTIAFANNYLLRGMMQAFKAEDFVPSSLEGDGD